MAGERAGRLVARLLLAITAISDFMCLSVSRDVLLTLSAVIRTQNCSHKDLVTDSATIRLERDMKCGHLSVIKGRLMTLKFSFIKLSLKICITRRVNGTRARLWSHLSVCLQIKCVQYELGFHVCKTIRYFHRILRSTNVLLE